jgi:hypothetical protein
MLDKSAVNMSLPHFWRQERQTTQKRIADPASILKSE